MDQGKMSERASSVMVAIKFVSGLVLSGLRRFVWPRPSRAFFALVAVSLLMDLLILGVVELKHEFSLLDPIVLLFFAKKILLDLSFVAVSSLLLLRLFRRTVWPAFAALAFGFLLIVVDTSVYFFGNTLFMRHHIAFATWTALKFFVSPAVIGILALFALLLFVSYNILRVLQPQARVVAALRWAVLGGVLLWFQPNNYIYKYQDHTKRLDHYIFRFRNSQLEYATQNSLVNFVTQMRQGGEAQKYKKTNKFSELSKVIAAHELNIAQAPPPSLGLKPFKHVIMLSVESLSLKLLGAFNDKLKIDTAPRFFSRPEIRSKVFANYWSSAEPTLPGLTVTYQSHPNYELAEPLHHPNAFPRLLSRQGYKTLFLRSASRFYADENIVLKDIGFQKIIAREDFFRDPKLQKYIYGWGLEDRKLYDFLVEYLKKHRDDKLFINLLGTDTHPPHGQEHYKYLKYPALPKNFRKTYGATPARFLKAIYNLDYDLSYLLDKLKKNGLFNDDTLIIVTADHSCPYNYLLKQVPGYPRDSIARIPLLFLTPQPLPAADRQQLASQLDFAPTLFHLMGLKPAAGWWGQSLFAPRRVPSYSYDAQILLERRENSKKMYNFKDPERVPADIRALFERIYTGPFAHDIR